jgi:hypothetical protein
MKEYFLRAIDLRLSAVRQDLTTAYATASASKTGKSRENLTVGLVMLVQISTLNKTKRPH